MYQFVTTMSCCLYHFLSTVELTITSYSSVNITPTYASKVPLNQSTNAETTFTDKGNIDVSAGVVPRSSGLDRAPSTAIFSTTATLYTLASNDSASPILPSIPTNSSATIVETFTTTGFYHLSTAVSSKEATTSHTQSSATVFLKSTATLPLDSTILITPITTTSVSIYPSGLVASHIVSLTSTTSNVLFSSSVLTASTTVYPSISTFDRVTTYTTPSPTTDTPTDVTTGILNSGSVSFLYFDALSVQF